MSSAIDAWEERLATAWQSLGSIPPSEFVSRIDVLAQELPPSDAVGIFERACARDSTGNTREAVPLYQAALAAGLRGTRRRRAAIQLASSLRALGKPHEALALLRAEASAPEDDLSTSVRAFLALTLVDVGREREAVAQSLLALSRHLPRYNASLERYARALLPIE